MCPLSWIIVIGIHVSLACDPFLCTSAPNGAYFCDPADSASYYRCEYDKPRHFTCGPGTFFDGRVCNVPQHACIPNPAPDTSPGTVIKGICEATAVSGDAATTTTTGSAGSIGTTAATGTSPLPNTDAAEHGVLWQRYKRRLNMKSACAVFKELHVATPISCASKCTMSGTCTGFSLYTHTHNVTPTLRYVCQLVACPGDHLLALAAECAFYDQI